MIWNLCQLAKGIYFLAALGGVILAGLDIITSGRPNSYLLEESFLVLLGRELVSIFIAFLIGSWVLLAEPPK